MNQKNFTVNRKPMLSFLKLFLIALFACGIACKQADAQLYTRTTFTSSYSPLTTATGATVSTATGDDADQTAIPLGFTLNYAGNNYSTIGLNTNGLLWFDATPGTFGNYISSMYASYGTNQSVSAWFCNMQDDASSDILYQTKGTAGSRTFTVQYTNYPHYLIGDNGGNIRLNFQVIFYEGTNVIEFNYGIRTVTGPPTISGGACIAIEYGAGGPGNFIDLVTGSSQTSHGMLSPLIAWPSYNYRLTPGAPTPVGAGTYNVGIGQTYPSLTLATSDLNHRGISGPVTLNLTDNNYDTTVANGSNIFPVFVGPFIGSSSVNTVTITKTGTPATLSYRGSPVVQGAFGYGSSLGLDGIQDSEEPIMGVCSRYTTISNINLVSLGTTVNDVEVGLMVFESFGGDSGAQHNVFDRISVNMDRTNTSTIAIFSHNITAPGGFQGTNSYNTFQDITIRDTHKGILLEGIGSATGQADFGNQITTSSCTIFNSIGDPSVPNDIGGGNNDAYGIAISAQDNFVVKNNIVRNVATTNNLNLADGIGIYSYFNLGEVSNNIVRTVKRINATSQFPAIGIKLNTTGNEIKELRVFNNSVSDISCTYSGGPTDAVKAQGIAVIGPGNVGKEKVYLYNNSVSMDGSTFINASNACLYLTSAGAENIVKNNVLANFTPAQTGSAKHFCFVTFSDTSIGFSPTVSASNYNDLFIANDQGTSGFVGAGSTANYSTLAAWQVGITRQAGTDANSVSANPNFVNNNSDLHATAASTALNGTGTTLPVYFTTDIDCQTRVAPHDIGFDDFSIPVNTYYADDDNDTYGDPNDFITSSSPTPPAGYVTNNTDCNDANAAVNPGATEICNGIDDDCDNLIDEGVQNTYYADVDNDGYGDAANDTLACSAPVGYVADNTDCDDNDNAINPGATEICGNGIDDDCDNLIDEGCGSFTYFADDDNDTYGNFNDSLVSASPTPPAGYVINSTDCDDTNSSINPGATEITCNGIDENCNGMADDGGTSTAPSGVTTNTALNTICLGSSVTLTVNGGSLGAGANWKWYEGGCASGSSIGTGNSVSITPSTGGSHSYFVRAEGGCGFTTCASVTVTVSTAPVTSHAILPFTGMPAYVCNGTVATLSIAPVNNATFYVWDAPAGSYFNSNPLNVSPFTTTTPSVQITFGNPSGSLYSVGVQAGNACGSSIQQSQKVRGTLTVPASISGAATVCANSSSNYSTAAVTAATSYLWTITGDATVSGTGITATVTFGPTWTGGTLCVASQTPCYTSPSKCIYISSSAATLNALSGTFTACPNTTGIYSVPASSGASSYTWTLPSGVSGSSTTNSINVAFAPTYNSGGNICVSVTSVCGVTSVPKCKTITPGLPSVPSSINGSLSGVCNQSVIYTCPSQGAGTTYTWTSPSNTTITGNGSNSVNIAFNTLSTGPVCVVANNSCGFSGTRCITVKGAPNSPSSITANPSIWCANDDGINFTANTTSLTGSYTLSWLYPASSVATYVAGGGNSNSLTLDWGTGNGSIVVIASNVCGSGSKAYNTTVSCREGDAANTSTVLQLYPNPATTVVNIRYTAVNNSNTEVKVLDITGRTVIQQSVTCINGINDLQLDMGKLSKGPYIIHLTNAGISTQKRIMIE